MNAKTLEEACGSIPPVGEIDRVIARNLRQPSSCGKGMILNMLNDPAGEEALAEFIAKHTLGIRRNEAGLTWQLLRRGAEAEAARRGLEAVVANCRDAVLALHPDLREIVEAGLGRKL